MVKVALAGCAGGFGHQILEAVLASKKHSIVLLTRTPKPSLTARGVDVRTVDYMDHSSLVSALQGVHTVIWTISAHFPDEQYKSEVALLEAAKEAGAKRFAPSEYAGKSNEGVELYAAKIKVWEACQASGLECTRLICGVFLNTMVTGTPKNQTEALGGLKPWNFLVAIPAGTADIPGDGKTPVPFTSTQDAGRFVAGSLDLERWEPVSGMAGGKKTYDEVVEIIERITGGKRKMLRKYTSAEELRRKAREETNMFVRSMCQFNALLADGEIDFEANLNELLPSVQPIGVEEFLRKYWEGVELPEPAWAA
ncbi:NAD-P-binding protein [Stereum hirsutum FP-91666 SS1]|uniref:NAD-P-binding protein n=1 Tax=Stereum hirsutum (strain FP-91666) TaxID=721885 RepID=UPI000441046C|nr:NAD-P-binding protein [Stereum hirsutum FP-91666 SS1]EIM90015.1 NAD-P-binding protein [Stereum hirsutum FP-91666 SS1]